MDSGVLDKSAAAQVAKVVDGNRGRDGLLRRVVGGRRDGLDGSGPGAQRHSDDVQPHRPDREHDVLLPGDGARRRRGVGSVGRGQREDGSSDPESAAGRP